MDTDTTSQPATWRYSKEESFSDWTLQVNDAEYHVHKLALIHPTSARQCRYFEPLFKRGSAFQENTNGVSVITLHEQAAAAFPQFLDYVYTGTTTVGHDNVVALRYLATYFMCSDFLKSKDYTKRDVPKKVSEFMQLYQDAVIFHDEVFQEYVVEELSKKMTTQSRTEERFFESERDQEDLMDSLVSNLLPKTFCVGIGLDAISQYYSCLKYILKSAVQDDPVKRKEIFATFCVEDKVRVAVASSFSHAVHGCLSPNN